METHAFPHLGQMNVAEITTRDVVDALRPIWHEKKEAGRRVRQRLRELFKWAIAMDYRTAANPADAVDAILGSQNRVVTNQPALPYKRIPELMLKLLAWPGLDQTKLAFEWLVLTAVRSKEVRRATWSEVDTEEWVWTISKSRMKTRREAHLVPLPKRCQEIYKECRERWPHQTYIFMGHVAGKPLSENALNNVLKKIGLATELKIGTNGDAEQVRLAVAHGMRSTHRDWAAEVGRVRFEVAEANLSHKVGDAATQAYHRAKYIEERRQVMEQWAQYCSHGSERSQA